MVAFSFGYQFGGEQEEGELNFVIIEEGRAYSDSLVMFKEVVIVAELN